MWLLLFLQLACSAAYEPAACALIASACAARAAPWRFFQTPQLRQCATGMLRAAGLAVCWGQRRASRLL